MKRFLQIVTGIMLGALLTGCGAGSEPDGSNLTGGVTMLGSARIVGTDIGIGDITDFYYTEENINYDAYYQRYRFYVENGKHIFFHETRERPNDYGPCTEEDTTRTSTVELTDDQWAEFTDLVSGGSVKARKESADSGDSGPWLYLYWTGDKDKYQQFSFTSYEDLQAFVEFCESLIIPQVDYEVEEVRCIYNYGDRDGAELDIYAADGTVTCYVISPYSDAGIDIFEGEIPSDDKCERTETTISENEWNSIVDAVKSSNFMGLPGELPEVEADDGSTCYIEVKTSAGDHRSGGYCAGNGIGKAHERFYSVRRVLWELIGK